MIVDLHVKQQ